MAIITVGVTGLNASDNPAPGVGVARSLREALGADVRIAGLAFDAMEPGVFLDALFDRCFLIPYPAAAPEALLERLAYIQERFGLDVMMPTLDSELPFFMRYAPQLADRGIRVCLPTAAQFRLRDKERLADIATRIGLAAPRQESVVSREALAEAAQRVGSPLMVKGALYGAWRAQSAEEAINLFPRAVARWGLPVILQEAIGGAEVNVIGVGDGRGGLLGLVAVKKLNLTELGKIWTGVTIHHDGLLAAAHRFAGETRWRGAFELECVLDDRDALHLIEINPRFPAWVWFAAAVGVNLPAMLLDLALADPADGAEPAKMMGAAEATGAAEISATPVASPDMNPVLSPVATPAPQYPAGKLYIRHTGEMVREMDRFQSMVTRGES